MRIGDASFLFFIFFAAIHNPHDAFPFSSDTQYTTHKPCLIQENLRVSCVSFSRNCQRFLEDEEIFDCEYKV